MQMSSVSYPKVLYWEFVSLTGYTKFCKKRTGCFMAAINAGVQLFATAIFLSFFDSLKSTV